MNAEKGAVWGAMRRETPKHLPKQRRGGWYVADKIVLSSSYSFFWKYPKTFQGHPSPLCSLGPKLCALQTPKSYVSCLWLALAGQRRVPALSFCPGKGLTFWTSGLRCPAHIGWAKPFLTFFFSLHQWLHTHQVEHRAKLILRRASDTV